MRSAWFAGTVVGCLAVAGTAAGVVAITSTDQCQADRLFRGIEKANDGGTRVVVENRIEDLLPSTLFHFSRTLESEDPRPLGAGLVIGRISDPAEIAAYTYGEEGDTAEEKVEVPSDSDALWRVVSFRLTVDQGLESFPDGTELDVGLVVSGGMSTGETIAGLKALDQVVVGLGDPGFFDADPRLYTIRDDGALLGEITEDGTITFPAMDPDDARAFIGDLDTPEELSEAAQQLPRVIEFDDGRGVPSSDPIPLQEWQREHQG